MTNIVKNIISNNQLVYWSILHRSKFYVTIPNLGLLITISTEYIENTSTDQWTSKCYQIPNIVDINFSGNIRPYKVMSIAQRDRVTTYNLTNDNYYYPTATTLISELNIKKFGPNNLILSDKLQLKLNNNNRYGFNIESSQNRNDVTQWIVQNKHLGMLDTNGIFNALLKLPDFKANNIELIDSNFILIGLTPNNQDNTPWCGFIIIDIKLGQIIHMLEIHTHINVDHIKVQVG